jgi:hypothetical protein
MPAQVAHTRAQTLVRYDRNRFSSARPVYCLSNPELSRKIGGTLLEAGPVHRSRAVTSNSGCPSSSNIGVPD